jgi:signal transduction histidine kinase
MSGASAPLRVLILEDSDNDAELLLRHLRRSGYDLDWVRVQTPEAFADALGVGGDGVSRDGVSRDGVSRDENKKKDWDVILSDFTMPRFSAPNALAIVKEHGIDVPFIIISGNVGEAAAASAMKAGAHDFLLKGSLARLVSAIERERAEARVRREHRRAVDELRESRARLQIAVQARDEFLSIASHELKTPLTSLSLQVESARQILETLASASGPAARLDAKLEGVSRQVARLTRLINGLLDVTRITSDRMPLDLDRFDLREAIEAVVAGTEDDLARSGSSLQIEASSAAVGSWDRLRIESVIYSLLSNAMKFGAGKPIQVSVNATPTEAVLVVTDQGIGIENGEQERIFRRFERAVPSKHFGGLGLGLWAARSIVEAHGGTISVASERGAGSTFKVRLPTSNGVPS